MDIPSKPGMTPPVCPEHPSVPVVARCVSCGRLLCSACRVVRGNRNYCRTCLAVQDAAAFGAGWPGLAEDIPPAPPDPPAQQGGAPAYGPPPGSAEWRYGYPPPGQPPPPGYYPGYTYQHYPLPPAQQKPAREVVFPGAPWGVGEALLIFVISVLLASGAALLLAQALKNTFSTVTATFVLIFLSSALLYTFLLAGTFYSVEIRHRSSLASLGIKRDGFGRGVALGFAIGLPLFLAAAFCAYLIQKLVNPTTTDQLSKSVTTLSSGTVSWGLIALLAVTLVILAPICEEVFFRGYLYPALRNRMGMHPAMVINGLLFALAHFELVGFLPRFVLGWGLSYIYERNRTLGGPITAHALYNGFILLLSGVFHVF